MGLLSPEPQKVRPNSAAVCVRHRPETTLLYQIVQEYWPEFQAELASHGKTLPAYVTSEFDEYLKCGRLEHGFLRVRCASCHDEKLVAFSCKKRGFCGSCGARRMADSAALGYIETCSECGGAVTKFGEISEHLREKLRIQITQLL